MIAGYFLCSFIGMIINVITVIFACGGYWMLGMSVHYPTRRFYCFSTALVVYNMQHNVDR